jgi:hypothetical protein
MHRQGSEEAGGAFRTIEAVCAFVRVHRIAHLRHTHTAYGRTHPLHVRRRGITVHHLRPPLAGITGAHHLNAVLGHSFDRCHWLLSTVQWDAGW